MSKTRARQLIKIPSIVEENDNENDSEEDALVFKN